MNYKDIKKIKKQIADTAVKLELTRASAASIAPQISGQPQVKGNKHSRVEDAAVTIVTLEDKLAKLHEELNDAINSIPNTPEGNIIRLKVVCGRTWRYIAHIQTGNGNNHNSVRMSVERYEW